MKKQRRKRGKFFKNKAVFDQIWAAVSTACVHTP